MAQVGRLETDENPVRLDRPDPTFEGQEERALPTAPRTREDYRRTSRNGRKVYALISDDSQVIEAEEYSQLKSRKQLAAETSGPGKEKRKWLGGGKPLSEQEAAELHEPFVSALIDIGGYADKAIWMDYPPDSGYEIWGNLTPEEAELLGEGLLKLGTHNVYVAEGVRAAVAWKDYAAILAIIAPRAQETVKVRRNAPKRTKPRINVSLFRKRAVS